MTRGHLMRLARRWHSRLIWPAGIALMCWVLSGLTHPLMVWTGPQAENMRPPQLNFDVATWRDNLSVASQHSTHGLAVIPTELGSMLRAADLERTTPASYFQQGRLQAYSDRDQAIWLARHYLGNERAGADKLKSVEFITEFSPAYPSVNRLLPVWRVEFDSSLHAFVHTETGSLALIGDNTKQALQHVFQWLHTHSYLSNWPWLQFLVAFVLITSLVTFSIAGTVLVFVMPKRKSISPHSRRWHRRAALLLYVPLLALSTSGTYHLIFSQLEEKIPGQKVLVTPPMNTGELEALIERLQPFAGMQIQQSSLVTSLDGHSYIRLQHARNEAPKTREQRFAGHPAYLQVDYVGSGGAISDEKLALEYASIVRPDAPQLVTQVNRFGGLYDFRNKRLPVWQATYQDEVIFIDPARQVLVERVSRPEQWERWSFSNLHKWNFMTPFMGRKNRDILLVIILAGFLFMLVAGIFITRGRRS